ncbi:MAG: hypothetical protein DYG89_38205 [Caldilinea sp. CFX5]|nr:hypothetical protein [Caldilinea sp. CFX5]
MDHTVTLTLPPKVYREAAKQATATNRTIEQVLAEQLEETQQPFPNIHVSPNRAAMAREDEAYQRLHPALAQQLLGYYVAIYQGQVVDHDLDEDALLERRRRNYAGKVVLVRRVEAEAVRELVLRSPRFGGY